MKKILNAQYWEKNWQAHQTGWDIGHASPPLVRYINQLKDKAVRILIPGAGSAYEAIYLHQAGFKNVFVCDWAVSSFAHLKTICPDFPEGHLIVGNFFELELTVDLLLEQTFFCAIQPTLRADYVKQSASLLAPNGKIAGLLFGVDFPFDGPPFGGQKKDYLNLFEPHFEVLKMAIEKKSIAPRAGNELFVEMKKR